MIQKISYERIPHQKEFHEDVTTKFLRLSCGFGGGKSYALVMKVLDLSYRNRHVPGGVVCPSIPDYKKDLLPMFEEILTDNNVNYHYHQTDKWWRFPWSKAKIQVVSAEKKIRGPNWGWAAINEVGLISWERMQEIIGRVRIRTAPRPQIAMSGTPEGTAHWTYEKFIEQPIPNSRVIYGDTRDNSANLSEDYIETLEGSYDKLMLDAYLRGMHVNMIANRFYYAYDPNKNDDAKIQYDPEKPVHVSLDFNVDPMCATLWQVYTFKKRGIMMYNPDGTPMKELRAYDQIELTGPEGADTAKMCQAFRARGLHPDHTFIYPDPAGRARSTKGQPDTTIIRNHGYTNIRVKTVAPQFRKRQLAHNNLLDKGLIKLHPENCRGLKRDYESVEQDIATFEKVKKNPKLTHFSDGADYMIDILFPLSGSKPNSRVVKFR